MPELPEVETVRRGLHPVWEGRRFVRVTCYRPDLRKPFPDGFAQILTGRTVQRLERRAKYLLAILSDNLALIIHLGMSGRMTIAPNRGAAVGTPDDNVTVGMHDHVVFVTDQGIRVTFTDPRRFGLMDLCNADALSDHPLLADLGPEPLSDAFTAASLTQSLDGKKTPIKTALLDQKLVSGLGNIYVCESLFRSHIHPERLAGSLTKAEAKSLTQSIKDVLTEAIAAGGSSLKDHQRPDGELGYFQHSFAVYDREAEPCPNRAQKCQGTVSRLVQAGRSTFFCPRCQK